MSIVRIGLAENEDFADGYDAIFGKKDAKTKAKPDEKKPEEKAKDKEKEEGKAK